MAFGELALKLFGYRFKDTQQAINPDRKQVSDIFSLREVVSSNLQVSQRKNSLEAAKHPHRRRFFIKKFQHYGKAKKMEGEFLSFSGYFNGNFIPSELNEVLLLSDIAVLTCLEF